MKKVKMISTNIDESIIKYKTCKNIVVRHYDVLIKYYLYGDAYEFLMIALWNILTFAM